MTPAAPPEVDNARRRLLARARRPRRCTNRFDPESDATPRCARVGSVIEQIDGTLRDRNATRNARSRPPNRSRGNAGLILLDARPSASRASDAVRRRLVAGNFPASLANRLPSQTGSRRNHRVAAVADGERLGRRPPAATALVQHGLDRRILRNKGRFELDVALHASSMTRKPAGDKPVEVSVLNGRNQTVNRRPLASLDVLWQRGLYALILKQHRCSCGSGLASITSPHRSPTPPRSLSACRSAPSVTRRQAGGELASWPHTPAVDLLCCRHVVPPPIRSSRILYCR